MDKKSLFKQWTKWRRIKPWYFMILALISGLLTVGALRANNLKMIELRQAVYEADERNGNVEKALRELREHVYGHMNTNLSAGPNAVHPPIQLKFTYERLLQARQKQASSSNSQIYTDAQKECERTIPNGVSGGVRLGCIQAYIKQRSPADVETVPKNLYQFDFVSPRWSPDLAGWSLAVTVLSVVMAVGVWLWQNVLRHLLRR